MLKKTCHVTRVKKTKFGAKKGLSQDKFSLFYKDYKSIFFRET
jgi:hypothetical protein